VTATKTSAIELEFEPLELRTAHPFGISSGTHSDHKNVLVKLKYGKHVGYGEAAPAEYHNETVETAIAVLGLIRDANVLGDDPFAIADVSNRLDKVIAMNNSAKSGIEMALHDIAGKIAGQPTFAMLGLSGLKPPMTDFTIGIDNLQMVEKKTREALDAGYKMLKVKQGTSYDRDIINTIRKIAPDMPLRVDANGAWTPKQAIEMSKFLHENGVQFIEQPLPKNAHKEDFRFVREHSPLPIFADESVSKSHDVARLAGCVDGVVVKLAKTGGLLEAIRVIHTARAHSMQIMFGCMIESSIGITAAAHLAPLVDHLDLDGAMLLAEDPFQGAVYDDGYMKLRDLPGLGVTPR
jgi:L-alanine-DL-glutamate epimerase-like enolase superfamily enzyme